MAAHRILDVRIRPDLKGRNFPFTSRLDDMSTSERGEPKEVIWAKIIVFCCQ